MSPQSLAWPGAGAGTKHLAVSLRSPATVNLPGPAIYTVSDDLLRAALPAAAGGSLHPVNRQIVSRGAFEVWTKSLARLEDDVNRLGDNRAGWFRRFWAKDCTEAGEDLGHEHISRHCIAFLLRIIGHRGQDH